MSALRTLYPAIEPYETGMLDVGDGHVLYYERVGTRGAGRACALVAARHEDLRLKQRLKASENLETKSL